MAIKNLGQFYSNVCPKCDCTSKQQSVTLGGTWWCGILQILAATQPSSERSQQELNYMFTQIANQVNKQL